MRLERTDVPRLGHGETMNPEVYILKLANGQYYIGSTSDFNCRLLDHQNGRVNSTKGKLPAVVVFRMQVDSLKLARQIEYKIKSKKSRKIVEQIIADQQIKFLEKSK